MVCIIIEERQSAVGMILL